MCGILLQANLNKKKINLTNFSEMLQSLNHRGPDAEGIYYNKNIALGHKRLSIIDLSKFANQPMISKNKNYILVFNGEIYNFKLIKKELIKKNYRFKTNSDTEVVLYSLIEWGEKALIKFNGMFALCFYNKKENTLLVARDRYGIKPIYYYNDNKSIIISSESKAIFKYNKFLNNLDFKGIHEYFTFQNFISNSTFVENIKLLEAGNYFKINLNNNSIFKKKYWDYEFSENIKFNNNIEYVNELDRLLNKSLKNHIVSDVEIGSFLSGGLDSALMTVYASKYINNIKTFTCGFELEKVGELEYAHDERKKAELISSIYQTEQYEIVLKNGDLLNCIDSFTYALEEPRIGVSYPNYYIAKLANKFVKVAISGTGGDELFAGYPWRYYSAISSSNFESYINNYYKYWQRLLTDSEKTKLFKHSELKKIDSNYTYNLFFQLLDSSNLDKKNQYNFVNFSLFFELKTFLHSLFVVEDKLSMNSSLEVRVPFMDNDLVNFALNTPLKTKLSSKTLYSLNENILKKKQDYYFKKYKNGKIILRNLSKKYLPKSIYSGRKRGFTAPDSAWNKRKGLDFVENILCQRNARINDFFSQSYIKNILDRHRKNIDNKRLLIWALISFEYYLKKYF